MAFRLTGFPHDEWHGLTEIGVSSVRYPWKVYTVEWLCAQPNGCRAESNIGYRLPYLDVALNYFFYNRA